MPTPFLVLGIRVVTIVAAQSLKLGMVLVKFFSISITITQFPFTAFFTSSDVLLFSFHSFQLARNLDIGTCLSFERTLSKINLKVQINPSSFVKITIRTTISLKPLIFTLGCRHKISNSDFAFS